MGGRFAGTAALAGGAAAACAWIKLEDPEISNDDSKRRDTAFRITLLYRDSGRDGEVSVLEKATGTAAYPSAFSGIQGFVSELATGHGFMAKMLPLEFHRISQEEQLRRSQQFLDAMLQRRTVREFSSETVPYGLIENAIRVAGAAPSGANQQPWRFVVVGDPAVKHQIREAAEAEERGFYEHRAPNEWLEALAPLGTDWRKEFLEVAPYLIVAFRLDYGLRPGMTGEAAKIKHYYVSESVGLACGMLLTALHLSGLATLTHTPSPMGFLTKILDRPANERPFLLIPVGYPAAGAMTPAFAREKKSLSEVLVRV
jgi:iodotyrosine deiodinase